MLQRHRLDHRVNALQIVEFAFRHDTPGLTEGVEVYIPRIGDLLIDAWVEVDEEWNGTTPHLDIGTFVDASMGLFNAGGPGAQLGPGFGDIENAGAGILYNQTQTSLAAIGARIAPARFTAANPLKVVVSQDGTSGGADSGATQGAAILVLVIHPA